MFHWKDGSYGRLNTSNTKTKQPTHPCAPPKEGTTFFILAVSFHILTINSVGALYLMPNQSKDKTKQQMSSR